MTVPSIPVVDAVLGAAACHLAVREVPPNHGRFVNAIQQYAGGKDGDPWCAGWVYYVAHHLLSDGWPLPRTMSCDVILRDAQRQELVVNEPVRGGLFLVLNPRNTNDAVHVGFIEAVRPDKGRHAFVSLEGNSNELGEREGVGVFRNLRGTLDDHRLYLFVDWERSLRAPHAKDQQADGGA